MILMEASGISTQTRVIDYSFLFRTVALSDWFGAISYDFQFLGNINDHASSRTQTQTTMAGRASDNYLDRSND